MRIHLIPFFLILAAAASAQTTTGWQLVWSDEFNGTAGSPPDPTKWNYDLGGGGWGNGEAETYTNSANNVFQDGNGNLVIRAIRDANGNYTSGRLQTGNPGAGTHTADNSWQYGMVVARIKLPFGHGVWPAFWMLGENIGTVSWPACGEVDIMENFGAYNNVNDEAVNNGTIHGPVSSAAGAGDYNGGSGIGASHTLPYGQQVDSDYHVYAIQWSQNSMQFFVDGVSYETRTTASLPSGAPWVFNNQFFILLNLAIGGPTTFLGTPSSTAPFANQDLVVDYVRVYQQTPASAAMPVITPGQVVNAASYTGDLAPGGLATVSGNNLASAPQTIAASPTFPTSAAGVSVQVNGVSAPLIYISPTQINFQIPWETTPGPYVPITVTWNTAVSATEYVTIAAPQAPSMFLSEYVNGVAWVTGTGCATSECAVEANGNYQLWANALGPKNGPSQDGAGAVYTGSLTPLEVPGSCQLTIGGQAATVQYCGAAPGEIIDQINFIYPSGVTSTTPYVEASLTLGNATGYFRVPAPATSIGLAQQLLAQMRPAEKLQLVQGAGGPVTNIIPLPRGAGGYIPGIPRLGIPALYFNDGSVGVANSQAPSTALPSAIASAASWDTNLAYQYGQVIGAEMNAWGLNVNLGGNVNLNREPRDGRTFEAKGEDPILAGKINAAHLSAIQDQHVVGDIKHYAVNDQETGRTTANAIIDERSARETDLLAFEIGVRDANVQSVMCSYNLVNGTYSCEDSHLLNSVLKGDWGFPGFVMSDWWATHSTVAAANAGLDQEQPDNQWYSGLNAAIQAGTVPESRLDDMVTRILSALYATGAMNGTGAVTSINTAADQAVAQAAEEQGAVLLRNTGNQLPLNPATVGSIAVIGSHADIGVLSGGGSAQVYPTGGAALNEGYPAVPGWSPVIWDPSSPLQSIQAMAAPAAKVQFDDGTNTPRAAALAASSAVAIVFVSQWTSEGMDMPSLNFTDVIHATPINQDGLVSAVAAANPHTIVVMENGGAQVLPWLNSVSAVLEAWFPGQRGGPAIANILFGAVNPSGKLPITFPASVNQLPHPTIAAPNPPSSTAPFPVNYSEGLLVGYKWYDANNLTPAFHFGFGLSYTTFSMANIALTNNLLTSYPNFQVSCDLTNTGSLSGAQVVQVYLALPASLGEPPRRLAGWQKVSLQPGASQRVTVEVDQLDYSHPMSWWNPADSAWETAAGAYTVYVGTSSASADLTVAGTLQVGL